MEPLGSATGITRLRWDRSVLLTTKAALRTFAECCGPLSLCTPSGPGPPSSRGVRSSKAQLSPAGELAGGHQGF